MSELMASGLGIVDHCPVAFPLTCSACSACSFRAPFVTFGPRDGLFPKRSKEYVEVLKVVVPQKRTSHPFRHGPYALHDHLLVSGFWVPNFGESLYSVVMFHVIVVGPELEATQRLQGRNPVALSDESVSQSSDEFVGRNPEQASQLHGRRSKSTTQQATDSTRPGLQTQKLVHGFI